MLVALRFAAAAGAFDVRVHDFEAGALEAVDEVNDTAFEPVSSSGFDMNFDTV